MAPEAKPKSYSFWRLFHYALSVITLIYMQLLWSAYETIPFSVMSCFDWDRSLIFILSNDWYIHFLTAPFAGYLFYLIGIKYSRVLSLSVVVLSFLIRSIDLPGLLYKHTSVLGVMLLSIGTVLDFGMLQQSLGSQYFKPGIEQSVVVTTSVIASAFSHAGGSVVFPYFVSDPLVAEDGNVVNKEGMRLEFLRTLKLLTLIGGILTAVSAVALPKDEGKLQQSYCTPTLLHRTLRELPKSFWLTAVCYGWMATLFYAQFPVAVAFLGVESLNMTQMEIGMVFAISVLVSTVMGFMLAMLAERGFLTLKKWMYLTFAIGSVGGVWLFLMCWKAAATGFWQCCVASTLIIIGQSATLGPVLQRATTLLPSDTPEEVSSTICSMSFFLLNTTGIYIQGLDCVPIEFSIYVVCFGSAVSAVLACATDL